MIHLFGPVAPLPDSFVTGPVLTALGVVIGSVLSFLGARFSAKQAAKSSGRQIEVSERQVDVEEWRGLVADLKDELRRLSARVDELEKKRESDRARFDALEALYRFALSYIRELLAWGRTVAPAERPPLPPSAIADEVH